MRAWRHAVDQPYDLLMRFDKRLHVGLFVVFRSPDGDPANEARKYEAVVNVFHHVDG